MPLSFVQDTRLTRYLLGALPEAETEQLDELSVVDDEFAARLRIAETDLIDAYVRGALPGELLERFESQYLASPKRRARVAFAKKFLSAVDAAAEAQETTAPSFGSQHRRPWTRLVPWVVAAAAALTLTTGALLVRNQHLSRDVQSAVAQTAAANRRADSLNDQLTEQRTAAEAARHALTEARATVAENAVALVLLPETRGTGPVPLVAVPRDAAVLTVDLRIDTAASASYDVALKDPATNRVLWRDRVAAAPASRPPTLVLVRIPGHFLKAQHYTLDLFDAPHGAPGAFVAGYAFEVVRR